MPMIVSDRIEVEDLDSPVVPEFFDEIPTGRDRYDRAAEDVRADRDDLRRDLGDLDPTEQDGERESGRGEDDRPFVSD
jgi:hypothetical protein